MKKKLLWISDAVCASGFAKATHYILDTLRHHYDVTVLGINYNGDPHKFPYDIYAAAPGGDAFGIGRLIWMCERMKMEGGAPDIIVIQQDGPYIPYYMARLRQKAENGEYLYPEFAAIPVVTAIAVDGQNFNGAYLNGVSKAIFWTDFARDEARTGGYLGPADVIPLGVDLDAYYPMDPRESRLRRNLPKHYDEQFIVGAVNRNQPRKRWDLLIKYYANWVHRYQVSNVTLFIHTAPTGENAVDINTLAKYYNISGGRANIITVEPGIFYGASEEMMRLTYNCFDVYVSTTQGEGFGLTTLEAMACGKPCIVPDWSGLGDWAKRGAVMVPCKQTAVQFGENSSVIGGIPDEESFIRSLHAVYSDIKLRKNNQQAALECAQLPRYRWENIGEEWVAALRSVVKDGVQDDAQWSKGNASTSQHDRSRDAGTHGGSSIQGGPDRSDGNETPNASGYEAERATSGQPA